MASSNKHWPSMFKSKPCNPNHQFQHNSLISSTGSHKSPYTSAGCEEKTPEAKPRWNPKPEQIQILETIFNSGMVNPPRDEIRKIRSRLQEYGEVGDANVFYWFQNRKSRSKQKLRKNIQLQQNSASTSPQSPLQNNPVPVPTNSSSSSSSEKSSPKDPIMIPPINNNRNVAIIGDVAVPNSPTASVNQNTTFFQPLVNETVNHIMIPTPAFDQSSYFFPVYQNNAAMTTQGNYDFVAEIFQHQGGHSVVGPCCTNMLQHSQSQSQFISFCQPSTTPTASVFPNSINNTIVTVPSPITHFQGAGDPSSGTARSTVLINDVAFEVVGGPFNVREAFGDEAMLIQSSGHPVLTDEWGVTLYPLQHGASYYLV